MTGGALAYAAHHEALAYIFPQRKGKKMIDATKFDELAKASARARRRYDELSEAASEAERLVDEARHEMIAADSALRNFINAAKDAAVEAA
ncbi:hypothetical protein Pan3_61 [Pseudanabaena phage Pan3]|nr:hypothetical protein Pan3_61 [Pseudanabaena phage Pan3]